MAATGAGIGSAIAMIFGLPPQVGAAGGSFVEDQFVTKKDKGHSLGSESASEAADGEDGGMDIMGMVSSLFGGQGGGSDPYMSAINGMASGGEPQERQLNTGRSSYAPPQLMGFPSSGMTGRSAAIKQALAAKRGF